MTWNDLTIGQYQRILGLLDGVVTEDATLDAEEQLLVEIAGYDHEELQKMSLSDFSRLFDKEFGFLSSEMPPEKPVKVVWCGHRAYNINFDVTKITKGEYDEVVAFSKNGVNHTLHQFMASITKPVWFWPGYKDHAKRSEDMKNTKFLHAYYASVFFWAVYKNLLKDIQTSLGSKLTNLTEKENQALATHLTSLFPTGDGTRITSR